MGFFFIKKIITYYNLEKIITPNHLRVKTDNEMLTLSVQAIELIRKYNEIFKLFLIFL